MSDADSPPSYRVIRRHEGDLRVPALTAEQREARAAHLDNGEGGGDAAMEAPAGAPRGTAARAGFPRDARGKEEPGHSRDPAKL